MRLLRWPLRLFILLTLVAFSLNNQQVTTVHWFFGLEWRAPMVIVVLAAFATGCAVGVFGMLPSWWRHRRLAKRRVPAPTPAVPPSVSPPVSDFGPEHPPRDGL